MTPECLRLDCVPALKEEGKSIKPNCNRADLSWIIALAENKEEKERQHQQQLKKTKKVKQMAIELRRIYKESRTFSGFTVLRTTVHCVFIRS